MTGREGNSEFCFPKTLNVHRGKAEGNIEVEGKQNSLFPAGPVFDINSQLKNRKKNCKEIIFLTPTGTQTCRGFKEHDLIKCKSKGQVVVSPGS